MNFYIGIETLELVCIFYQLLLFKIFLTSVKFFRYFLPRLVQPVPKFVNFFFNNIIVLALKRPKNCIFFEILNSF